MERAAQSGRLLTTLGTILRHTLAEILKADAYIFDFVQRINSNALIDGGEVVTTGGLTGG